MLCIRSTKSGLDGPPFPNSSTNRGANGKPTGWSLGCPVRQKVASALIVAHAWENEDGQTR